MSILFLIPQHSYESNRVKEELNRLQKTAIEINTWDSINYPLTIFPKVVWVRFSPKVPIVYQLTAIEDFERNGSRVVNCKEAIETCDKMSSYLFWNHSLHQEFLMPQTVITRNLSQAVEFVQQHACVFKPIALGLGQGIQRVDNNPQLSTMLQELLTQYGILFLQEFISNPGYDIRAIVINGENIIEYARTNPSDFRYNIHAGGQIKAVDEFHINPAILRKLKDIALKIARKTKLDLVGVDFLLSNTQKLYVLEWNAFFNFQGAETILKVNVAKKIAEFLVELVSA